MSLTKFSYKFGCKLRLKLPLKQTNMTIYFENIIVRLHVLYVFNTHIKFCVNQILFIIQSRNLFFLRNFKLQKLEI